MRCVFVPRIVIRGLMITTFALSPSAAHAAAAAPTPQEAGICVFRTHGDSVHVSSTAFEASGHGWWVNVNCNATAAIVTVQLQQYDGAWRNAGLAGRLTVKSGGGRGNRATGRATCSSKEPTQWRSVIDVDVIGVADSPGTTETPSRSIGCRH